MSSLQKFHRRTNNAVVVASATWPPTVIGMGDDTKGYWLGGVSTDKLIVAPKSTEVSLVWGSSGATRGTTSTTNGLANTNTLVSFGTAAHPAAGHCKYLSTGGYNTWYMPAKDECMTLYSNKSATPFATTNSFSTTTLYYTSTEANAALAWRQNFAFGIQSAGGGDPSFPKSLSYLVRAVRKLGTSGGGQGL